MDRGVVVSFDEGRGFGFIRARGRDEEIFVHARDLPGGRPLRVGQRVRFEAESGEKGPRAVKVRPGRRGLPPAGAAAIGLSTALAAATLGSHRLGLSWLAAWLAAINATTLIAYAWDKRQARRHGRRLPERALLALAFVGGSPAAALAMALLAHKTRKASFRIAFAGVVASQAALLAAWSRWR